MSQVMEMGGYGIFVWGAYGPCIGVLLANVVWARRQRKKIFRQLHLFFLRPTK